MNPLLAKATPYILGFFLLGLLGGGWQLVKSIKRNGELETKLAQQVAEAKECADANTSNNVTITGLKKLIDDMVEERRVDTEERERVWVEREADLLRALARADELERERNDEIISNEQCMEFNSLDPARFCPESARQLRLRSRGQSGDGDTDG